MPGLLERTATAAALILAGLAPQMSAVEIMKKVLFPPEVKGAYSASCLDGSPAGYFISEHPNSTGWSIYLQGGGLCVTRSDCEKRVKTELGSSTHWPPTHTDSNNVLSGVEDGNPLGTFSKVWVPYCSGDTYTGTTMSNQHLGGLPTTGHNIMVALVDHLINTTSFKRATHVLLSGGSAGGIGVFHNADWLTDTVHARVNPNAIVKGSPQGGYFFPDNVTFFWAYAAGIRFPFDVIAADYAHWLEGGYMNEACAAAYGDKRSQCWDIAVVQKFLKTPLFVAQNQIDSEQVQDELLCPDKDCHENPTDSAARSFMADYKVQVISSLKRFAQDGPGRVVWSPSCYRHCENLCMSRKNNPAVIDGITYAQGLGSWFFNGTHSGEVHIESCPNGEMLCGACGNGCDDA